MHTLNFQLQMPKGLNLAPADIDQVERLMPDLLGLMIERRALLGKQRREELIELMVRDVPMLSIDMKIAKLQARALEQIYGGTSWLKAEEIGTLGKHGTANPSAAAHRWKSGGKLFAIRRHGLDMYPRYALGDDFTPLPVIRKVIKVMGSVDPLRLASWFESASSFLGGKRPRELIATQPERVIECANDTVLQLVAS